MAAHNCNLCMRQTEAEAQKFKANLMRSRLSQKAKQNYIDTLVFSILRIITEFYGNAVLVCVQ